MVRDVCRGTTFPAIAAVVLVLALAACGGESETAAETPSTTTTEQSETLPTTDTDESEETETTTGSGPTSSGPAPAPGQGSLDLDDGRSYAITITECRFDPNGTFTVKGSSTEATTFEMTQFYLGEQWSQSQVSLEFPNRDQIYVIVGRLADDAEPATVEGKSISWTRMFRELDESANMHVYTGEGTVRLTCP